MMIHKLLLGTFLIFFLGFADGIQAQSGAEKITEEFFRQYALDTMKAFDYAFSTNKWMERNQDAVDNLKMDNQTNLRRFRTRHRRSNVRWS